MNNEGLMHVKYLLKVETAERHPFDDILLTFLQFTSCNLKVDSDHELILCCELVHNVGLMHAKYIYFFLSQYVRPAAILKIFLHVTTSNWKEV